MHSFNSTDRVLHTRHELLLGAEYTVVNKTNEVPTLLKLTQPSRDRPQVNKQTNQSVTVCSMLWKNVSFD